MATLSRSSWIDVAKFEPQLRDHVQDIITFDYEAQNVSADSVRFSIRSPGPRSLLDSDVTIRLPIKIYPKGCYRFLSDTAAHGGNQDGMDIGFAMNALNDPTNLETRVKALTGPGLETNLGTCIRSSGLVKALSSVVVEINGTSISYTPADWIHLTDSFLVTDEDERQDVSGLPMDSGSDGNFIGRAYRTNMPREVNNNGYSTLLNGDYLSARDSTHEIDRGMSRRVQKFKKGAVHDHTTPESNADARYNGLANAPSGTLAGCGGPYEYTLVSKLPVAPFSYYQNGMGSKRRSMIPFISTLSIQLNFRSNPTRFWSLIQCTGLQGNVVTQQGTMRPAQITARVNLNNSFTVEQAYTQQPNNQSHVTMASSTPHLICRWVNPKPQHQLQPSYVLSSPRWVTYKKQALTSALATAATGYAFRFNQIKLSSLPPLMIISCKPKCQAGWAYTSVDEFRTTFANSAYCDTFDCLYSAGEDKPTALKITVNEKSSLVASYTHRDLYNILLKAVPGYRYSYETWRREKMLIVLTPDCFPSEKPANVFFPSTISIEAPFVLSTRHKAYNQQLAVVAPNAAALSECSLSLFYEDSLALSANACAVQQFMVNESALSQKPTSSVAPGLDGLSL